MTSPLCTRCFLFAAHRIALHCIEMKANPNKFVAIAFVVSGCSVQMHHKKLHKIEVLHNANGEWNKSQSYEESTALFTRFCWWCSTRTVRKCGTTSTLTPTTTATNTPTIMMTQQIREKNYTEPASTDNKRLQDALSFPNSSNTSHFVLHTLQSRDS